VKQACWNTEQIPQAKGTSQVKEMLKAEMLTQNKY